MRSFENCPAPLAAEILELAKKFNVGIVAVRPSKRSFSNWVCICSFRDSQTAEAFKRKACRLFFSEDVYLATRCGNRGRVRVSVPCLSPENLIIRIFPRFRKFKKYRIYEPIQYALKMASNNRESR
jgi:hypothetical protein